MRKDQIDVDSGGDDNAGELRRIDAPVEPAGVRRVRSDALRNIDALLEAAKEVFASRGVDAPMREIAAKAGVGVGTVYRHFPQRSDLISAVFRREIDACAEAAATLAAEYEPGEALDRWLQRYTDFIATKRGLAAALHSGDPAFDALPGYFDQRFNPALGSLLSAAAATGRVRSDVAADDLLRAMANLCLTTDRDRPGHSQRMVALLIDGLRYFDDSDSLLPTDGHRLTRPRPTASPKTGARVASG